MNTYYILGIIHLKSKLAEIIRNFHMNTSIPPCNSRQKCLFRNCPTLLVPSPQAWSYPPSMQKSVQLYSTLMPEGLVCLMMWKKSIVYPKEPKPTNLFPLSSWVTLSCAAKNPNNQPDLWKDNNSQPIYWRQSVSLQVIESSCIWMTASVNMKSSFSLASLGYF